MQKIVIIGNGIAGITAARHIRKLSDDEILVISGETAHFFSRTALMYIYMGHMKYENTKPYEDWFWAKNNISLLQAWVKDIDFDGNSLTLSDGGLIKYDKLILATGSQSNKFGWPGQDLIGVQGLYSFQDLELMEENTKGVSRAVIIGGGLIGVEMAEMLLSRGIQVTYLIREKNFWDNVLPPEEAQLVDRHLLEHHIDLRNETELEEIIGDEKGKVKAIKTKSGEIIDCQFVGLTVGVHPSIALVKDTPLETDRGILVDDYLETSIPGVFAVGDCVQLRHPAPHRRAIEAVWYAGRMMGETVAHTITGNRTKYKPGIWFNSAKFFDIEYQTYGLVLPRLNENQSHFYWESDNGKKCIKIVFETESKKVNGVNLFGIRNRHEVWDRWLKEEKSIEFVIQHLDEANFDPEFFKKHENEISTHFSNAYPEFGIPRKRKSIFQKIFTL